jgi:predicted TIM-barrel fold metal-dependent hydrolase
MTLEIEPMEQKEAVNMAYANPREDWLTSMTEDVVDPHRIIVDAHHHLWDRPGARYMLEEFLTDVDDAGHAIAATVYVECRSMYRREGPANRRSIGEVEFASDVAKASEASRDASIRVCSGIVGRTDFRALGNEAEEILGSLIEKGNGGLRGIRQSSNWTDDKEISPAIDDRPRYLLLDEEFRRGFSWLSWFGLSFDAFLFHPQIPDLIDLAHTFPDTTIVVNHLGGPIGIVRGGSLQKCAFDHWQLLIKELAKCPNVSIKLGGLGMKYSGFEFYSRISPLTSDQVAEAWRPLVETAIEAFGVKRSMFESNFPPDKGSCGYRILWNAFKKITMSYSEDEKNDLFSGTAKECYRLKRSA